VPLIRATQMRPIDCVNNIRKVRSETRCCSKRVSWEAWRRSVISALSTLLETGRVRVTLFLQPIGIDVQPNAVTLTHSTISASCTCSAKASSLTRTKDCLGCDVQQIKETSKLRDYLLISFATAAMAFRLTLRKRISGRRDIERLPFIDCGNKSGAQKEPRVRVRANHLRTGSDLRTARDVTLSVKPSWLDKGILNTECPTRP